MKHAALRRLATPTPEALTAVFRRLDAEVSRNDTRMEKRDRRVEASDRGEEWPEEPVTAVSALPYVR